MGGAPAALLLEEAGSQATCSLLHQYDHAACWAGEGRQLQANTGEKKQDYFPATSAPQTSFLRDCRAACASPREKP